MYCYYWSYRHYYGRYLHKTIKVQATSTLLTPRANGRHDISSTITCCVLVLPRLQGCNILLPLPLHYLTAAAATLTCLIEYPLTATLATTSSIRLSKKRWSPLVRVFPAPPTQELINISYLHYNDFRTHQQPATAVSNRYPATDKLERGRARQQRDKTPGSGIHFRGRMDVVLETTKTAEHDQQTRPESVEL